MKTLKHLSDEALLNYYRLLKHLSVRAMDTKINGYSTKFAYHLVRLLGEAEQILSEGTLDLQKNREQLKSIRRGEWTMKQVEKYFERKELQLEELYAKSTLPHKPDEGAVRKLLMECLEMHYGSLEKCVIPEDSLAKDLKAIAEIAAKYN